MYVDSMCVYIYTTELEWPHSHVTGMMVIYWNDGYIYIYKYNPAIFVHILTPRKQNRNLSFTIQVFLPWDVDVFPHFFWAALIIFAMFLA